MAEISEPDKHTFGLLWHSKVLTFGWDCVCVYFAIISVSVVGCSICAFMISFGRQIFKSEMSGVKFFRAVVSTILYQFIYYDVMFDGILYTAGMCRVYCTFAVYILVL